MTREFKIDITLAQAMAQLLEEIMEAVLDDQLDPNEPCTDTFLDQFMPNAFVADEELIQALLASGIIKKFEKD